MCWISAITAERMETLSPRAASIAELHVNKNRVDDTFSDSGGEGQRGFCMSLVCRADGGEMFVATHAAGTQSILVLKRGTRPIAVHVQLVYNLQ